MLVSVGLPVVSISLFLGGVEPVEVWLCYGLSFSTLYFLAGVAIFASALSARPRDAIVLRLCDRGGLAIPSGPGTNAQGHRRRNGPGGGIRFSAHAVDHRQHTVVSAVPQLVRAGQRSDRRLPWMLGLQVAFGTVLLAWATVRLRPLEKGSRLRVLGWLGGREPSQPRRLLGRRPCGDAPMIWKECSGSVSSVSLVRLIMVTTLGSTAILGLGYWVYALALPAFHEVLDYGYGAAGNQSAREALERLGPDLHCCPLYPFRPAHGGIRGHQRDLGTRKGDLGQPHRNPPHRTRDRSGEDPGLHLARFQFSSPPCFWCGSLASYAARFIRSDSC